MVDVQQCRFRLVYDSSSSWFGRTEKYLCPNPVERDNLCIFHLAKSDSGWNFDATTQKQDSDKFHEKFAELVSEVTTNHNIEKYDFSGFKFPYGSDLSGRTFEKGADFQEADFAGWVRFNETVFRKQAVFSNAVFERDTSFDNCTFDQEAYFQATEFKENCSFSKTTFNQRATFSISEFSKNVTFYGVTFHRGADFDYCTFSERTQFVGDIDSPCFLAECDFRFLTLVKGSLLVFEKVNLGMARFLDTDLADIIFRDVEWRSIRHQDKAYPLFTTSSILDWPDFMESLKRSDTLESPMRQFVNLVERIEKKHAAKTPADHVSMSQFLRSTRNLNAPDPRRILRDWLTEQSKNLISTYELDQNLDDASKSLIVRDLNRLLATKGFYDRDSFLDLDPAPEAMLLLEKGADRISKKNLVRLNRLLIEAVFPYDIAKRGKHLRGRKQNALWDEFRTLEGWEAGREYGKIAENYSQLVINYERKRDFDTAEDFHIGEMEMRRKKKGAGVPRGWKRSLRKCVNSYSVYRALNNYGTSYWQAFAVLIGMILVISWVLLFTGLQPTKDYAASSNRILDYDFTSDPSRWVPFGQFISDYWKSVSLSLSIVTFQRERMYEPAGELSRLWLSIASVASATQIALTLLAIRRRFKR